jgi:hypothetical protein
MKVISVGRAAVRAHPRVAGELPTLQREAHEERITRSSAVEGHFEERPSIAVAASRHAGIEPVDGAAEAVSVPRLSLGNQPGSAAETFQQRVWTFPVPRCLHARQHLQHTVCFDQGLCQFRYLHAAGSKGSSNS